MFLNLDRRPGILVLINDTDWELLVRLSLSVAHQQGECEYVVNDKDVIVFISTLHGG